MNDVSINSILDLAEMTQMRVNVDWSEVDFKNMIHNGSNKDLLEELKKPDKSLKTKENYLTIQMVVSVNLD